MTNLRCAMPRGAALAAIPAVLLGAAAGLLGCGGDSGQAQSGAETLARIKRDGVVRWGADPAGGAPYAFFDPKEPEKVVGLEIDIMDRLAGHMGVKHQMVRSAWGSLLEGLKARRSDLVINGIGIDAERQNGFAFSKPYYRYEQMLTVRAADKDKYRSLADLQGRKVGTLSGAQANRVLQAAGFSKELLTPCEDPSTPYQQLELGRVEAVLQEQPIAEWYAGPNARLFNVPRTFAPGRYAVAMRKEDAGLVAEVDRVLELMKKNGELAAIYRKWKLLNGAQKELGIVEKAAAPGKNDP